MKKIAILVTAIVVLVCGIGMTVKAASSNENGKISKEQYRKMEEEYMEEVREILLEKGCKNAGITLTYVSDTEENRNYTVTVHHARLEKMDAQRLGVLEARLQESGTAILLAEVEVKQL